MLSKINIYELLKVGAVIIIAFFLYFKDNTVNVNSTSNGKEILSEKITRKVVIDTIPFYYPVPIYTQVKISPPVDSLKTTSGTLYTYENPVDDSLITGHITTESYGRIVKQGINYKPKFPKYITRDSTITIEREVTNPKAYIYFGIGAYAGLNQFDIIPQVGFKFKNDNFVSLGYGIRNNTINFNIYKPIKFKRNKKISLL